MEEDEKRKKKKNATFLKESEVGRGKMNCPPIPKREGIELGGGGVNGLPLGELWKQSSIASIILYIKATVVSVCLSGQCLS